MVQSSQQTNESKPKGQLDARALKEAKKFTIVFDDGKGIEGKLIEVDNYNLLVKSSGKRLLVPKHSVKYVILPETRNMMS